MPEILHDFYIKAPAARIFDQVSLPAGLDSWWTETSSGLPEIGSIYELHFAPDYHWTAIVTKYQTGVVFELTMKKSDVDWDGTRIGFEIVSYTEGSSVRFYHTGWPLANEHFRISSFCWAMYLRLLKRNLETGESVPYPLRLEV